MNKKYLCLVFGIAAFSQLAFAEDPAPVVPSPEKDGPVIMPVDFYDPRLSGLNPLQGSEWAKNNPGKLPYEKCTIQAFDDSNVLEPIELNVLFVSSSPSVYSDYYRLYLTCYAPSLKIGYRIPLHFSANSINLGLYLNLFFSLTFDSDTDVVKLNGKPLAAIYGNYDGFAVGAGIFVGGVSYSSATNDNGVKIKTSSANMLKVLELGESNFSITQCHRLTVADCNNPFVIIGGNTSLERNRARDCKPADTLSDVEKIQRARLSRSVTGLEFVKIKRQD